VARARRRVYYSGTVQGVGFRFTARRLAGDYPVTGFVRNLPDGRVELVAEGEEGDVEAFLDAVAGAMRGYIRKVEVLEEPPTETCRGFDIAF